MTLQATLTRPLRILAAAGTLCWWFGGSPPAQAAPPLPLCRLALEAWIPTNFQATLFHRGPMAADDQELVNQILDNRQRGGANLDLVTVDLSDAPSPEMQALWSTQTNPETPWLVVRIPGPDGKTSPAWAGRLKLDSVLALFDSPARRTVTAALLRGETAVWVLIESGNTVADEAAVDQLASNLKAVEKTLRPPPANPTNAAPRSPTPAAVSFALVRVTRTDPAEEFFVTCLMQGVAPAATRPAVIPVFGRGHLLPPLVGKKISAKSIQQVCRRLVSPFVHDPKESLPGRNLLLGAHWGSRAAAPAVAAAPASPASSTATNAAAPLAAAAPALEAVSPATAPAASAAHSSSAKGRSTRLGLLVAALCLVGAVVVVYSVNRRRVRSASAE